MSERDGGVGPASIWFLRIVGLVVGLTVLWFLVDAVPG